MDIYSIKVVLIIAWCMLLLGWIIYGIYMAFSYKWESAFDSETYDLVRESIKSNKEQVRLEVLDELEQALINEKERRNHE